MLLIQYYRKVIAQFIEAGNIDGLALFRYLTWKILTDGI